MCVCVCVCVCVSTAYLEAGTRARVEGPVAVRDLERRQPFLDRVERSVIDAPPAVGRNVVLKLNLSVGHFEISAKE